MCATVCPSEALYFGSREELQRKRRETPINSFVFGQHRVKTKVSLMVDAKTEQLNLDVASFIREE
jgi:formate hydrogenlyase subunit 6/NADH:ubiquinone oxidoreductase subunit I